MKLQDKTVIVTGAGNGIGAAIACRFAREKPRGVVVADIDEARAEQVAGKIRPLGVDAMACRTDVGDPVQVGNLVSAAERAYGAVDVVCSNAGIATGMGVHAAETLWARSWAVNVLAHVYLAQAVIPSMSVRREGHFLITASAAGLLGLPGDAPYSVTKHAAVGLAEWLAVTYRRAGIGVSVLCPLGVRTELLMPGVAAGHPAARTVASFAPILEPDEVAEATLRGIVAERFLILPHQEVAEMYAKKAADPETWLAETQREAR
ncbi:MAG: SDR family oxidoreductase [Haloechinothrix sp.]